MTLDGLLPEHITRAADALAAGQLIGLPTETVYGLAADACNDDAVRAIFVAKGRPVDHPLIVHVSHASAISTFASDMPEFARRLVQVFWPGPLTLILPRRVGVAAAAAGGHATIGLRSPSNPVAQALMLACLDRGVWGLAAPSANRFGRVSPTTAEHVRSELGPDLLVLDGGVCSVGIESTIVDASRQAPVLLRPGQITRADLAQVARRKILSARELSGAPTAASGTLSAHYAPTAKVRLMDAKTLTAAMDVLGSQACEIGVWSRVPLKVAARGMIVERMPEDAAQAAQQLFAVLRRFDDDGVKLIWVEAPPADPTWDGVRDRLQRAAASA